MDTAVAKFKQNPNIPTLGEVINPKNIGKEAPRSQEDTLRDMSNEVTAKTFAFNANEAQKARDFQEYMSNTSHQREVEDLKNAGLNPVLSANGGAAGYSAASASGSADNSAVGVLASIYQTKMNNDNAIKIAKMQNQNSKEIAKINAAASNYASNNAYAASRYSADQNYSSTQYSADRSRYGLIDSFVNGLLGKKSSSATNNVASKLANGLKKIVKK